MIHWVSAAHCLPIKVYQYDRLFTDANPAREADFLQFLNPNSLQTLKAWCEPSLLTQKPDEVFQFERLGYYCVNAVEEGKVLAFHRVVDLKDNWAKIG